MGKRGPKPTPTPVLKLRNAFRQDRHGSRAGCDIFDHKRPRCPQRFIKRLQNDDAEYSRMAAKSAWDRLSGQLFEAGLLVDAFAMSFEMLCDSWGRYRLACRKCDEAGMVTTGAKDNEVKSPWTRLRSDFLDEVTRLAGAFGLTPSDIARVRPLAKPTIDDAKKRFFGNDPA